MAVKSITMKPMGMIAQIFGTFPWSGPRSSGMGPLSVNSTICQLFAPISACDPGLNIMRPDTEIVSESTTYDNYDHRSL